MEIVGYIGILLVGVTLAVIGGGGSILTVPILIYLFKLPADLATSYSLFLVGISAVAGAFEYGKQNLIAYRTGVIFAIPAFLGVFTVRKYLMPVIPANFEVWGALITKDKLILVTFATIMLLAAISMIRDSGKNRSDSSSKENRNLNLFVVALEGLIVGGITGFVGAGGGFLIIPALVLLAQLPVKEAVGTSLMIIAAKSLFGFTGDIGQLQIDWIFLGSASAISIFGIFIGGRVAKFVRAEALKPLFGYFTLVMGCIIILQQLSA